MLSVVYLYKFDQFVYDGRIQNLLDPWTRSMDPVHGPPHEQPLIFPNFQKEIASANMKIHHRSGYEKHRLLFIAYVLEGLSRNSRLLWDRAPKISLMYKLVLRCRRSSAFLPPPFLF